MTTQRTGRFLLIDGHSLLHRAFHALPTMTTSTGVHTNAVYGFATMLTRLLDDEDPDYVAVAFDHAAPTFRHDAYAEYKAHRPAMADELRTQIPLVRELVEAHNIAICELEGYEGDDVLGTLAQQACEGGCFVVIVTGDKDALQLIQPEIEVLITRRGITEMERFTSKHVQEQMGVAPAQLVDWKALVGDKSDNIPGVTGIGEKTATRLLQEYGSLASILKHVEEIPGKAGTNLRAQRQQALLSQQLAAIATNAPIDIDWEAVTRHVPNVERLAALYVEIESRSLLNQLRRRYPAEVVPFEGLGERDKARLGEPGVLPGMESSPSAGDAEFECVVVDRGGWQGATVSLKDPVTALALLSKNGQLVACSVADERHLVLADSSCAGEFVNLMTSGRQVCTHNLKPQLVAAIKLGAQLPGPEQVCSVDDLLLGAYLSNPSQGDHSLASLALQLGHQNLPPLPEEIEITSTIGSELLHAVGYRHRLLSMAMSEFRKKMVANSMFDLYRDVEMPLTVVLAHMEHAGIAVDPERLARMSVDMAEEVEWLSRRIYSIAGMEFNINSPKQLATVLFEKLKLPVKKSTKTGPSTSAEVLEELATEHELPRLLLDYRQLAKLTGTYVDALPSQLDPGTGRVHTTFNQAVTATGRLSSTNPNLQNIPVRTALGRQIRSAFVPSKKEWMLISADYSQIELRVLAHLSQDENLLTAFRAGVDIHTKTASEVFDVCPEEVTPEMRSAAKAINFGIVYGISGFGLARGTGLSRRDAQAYIDGYFERYQGVRRYMEEIVMMGRAHGYVTTLLNRRRYLPDLSSRRWQARKFAERTAMNTPIQGSAADIIKLAMLKVFERLSREGLRTRMLLQVHDELVFEAPLEEIDKAVDLICEEMENAYPLDVPLVVGVGVGPNWLDLEEMAHA